MTYEARPLRRQKVRYNSLNEDAPLLYQLVLRGEKVEPGTADITIYSPNGTELVSDTMDVEGSIATYAVDTTSQDLWAVGNGYRAHITATVDSAGYEDDLIFDVCPFLLLLDVGRDQLVALDDRIRGMDHDGDEDFSEVIEAVRDELQMLIESRALDSGTMLENMFIDKSRVSIPARYRILAQIFESKQNYEAADRYQKMFDKLWREMLGGMKFDSNQDLIEDSKPRGFGGVRLTY